MVGPKYGDTGEYKIKDIVHSIYEKCLQHSVINMHVSAPLKQLF